MCADSLLKRTKKPQNLEHVSRFHDAIDEGGSCGRVYFVYFYLLKVGAEFDFVAFFFGVCL